jgi:hypothetical protein
MIYNGITITKDEASKLLELYGKVIGDRNLFYWMHGIGLCDLFEGFKSALEDPIDSHIESYHE